MADHCACTIPLQRIDRIRLYINTARKSLAAIRAETGAEYLLNGTLYDMASFLPVCHLKADGEVLCRPAYSVAGYAWDQGADIAMMTLPEAARRNYIACTPLVVDGKKVEALTYDPGQGGKRGRSAMGIKDGRLALYCTRDGGTMVRTPEQLRDDLLAAGWESAIMLDGGGSSQCDFAGQRVESSRAVHDVILVYLKKEGDTVDETKTVVLDAGHDAANLANRSPDGAYYEHEFCLDMAKRMGAHLRRCGVTVVETRPDGAAVSLAERCAIANKIKDLDLFVSLHSNAAGGSGWSGARGWSAYVYGAGGERERAAGAILARVRETGTAVRSAPIVYDPSLYVLKHTAAPAVLIEHAFHTNEADVENLKNADWRSAVAEAQARGITDYLGIVWVSQPPRESDEDEELEQAVDALAAAGIIDSPDRWKAMKYTDRSVRALLIKMAAKLA